MARLAAPAGAVEVVSPRTGGETPSLLLEVEQTRSTAQASVLSAPRALAAAGVTPLARPGADVAIATRGQIAGGGWGGGGDDDRLHPIKQDRIRAFAAEWRRKFGSTATQSHVCVTTASGENKTLQTGRGLERLFTASAGLPVPFVVPVKGSAPRQNGNVFI